MTIQQSSWNLQGSSSHRPIKMPLHIDAAADDIAQVASMAINSNITPLSENRSYGRKTTTNSNANAKMYGDSKINMIL